MDLAETCPLLIRHQLVSWPTFIQAPIHAPVRESSRLSPPDVRGARCEDRQQLFLKCMAGSPNLIDTAPPGDHDGRARCYTTLQDTIDWSPMGRACFAPRAQCQR